MKINLKDEKKFNEKIVEVEKRAQVRTVGDLETFKLRTEDLFEKIDSMLPKKDQVGICVHIDINAQNFPNAYKGNPESTYVTIKRFHSGWFMIDCGRSGCSPWSGKYDIRMSEDQKLKAIEYMIQYKNW